MAQVCPSCGTSSPPETRFCRLCGTLLQRNTSGVGQAPVSPIAQTVPLKDEARSTDGLAPEDPRRSSPDTTRVAQSEIEELLKAAQKGRAPEEQNSESPEYIAISTAHGAAESSRLTTSRLDVPTIASTEATGIPVETAAASPAQAEGASRKRPVWPITVAALLLIALACGVLVYMLARSRSSSESKSSATAPTEAKGSGEEVAQVNGAESKSGVQQPAPTSSVARPESSVDRATQERSALNHLSEEAAASNANAIAHAAPDAQPEQPKPNTKPAGSVTDHYKRGLDLWGQNRQAAIQEFRVAAQSNPDAYYYLGLNLAEGRDPHVLQRAELVAALQYFQLAQRGAHRAEAAQYAERLGREYDRRRNQR